LGKQAAALLALRPVRSRIRGRCLDQGFSRFVGRRGLQCLLSYHKRSRKRYTRVCALKSCCRQFQNPVLCMILAASSTTFAWTHPRSENPWRN